MTVDELWDRMNELNMQGKGNYPVKIFDPDSEEGGYYPITGMTILDNEIQLHCDEL